MSPVFRHGRLRLYLLKLLDESPRHGYEVIRLLQDRFMGVYAPSPGTIYPRLARLEEDGLVTHEEVDGKKVYSITDKGREEIRSRLGDLADLEDELTESLRDVAREISEDVRDTVRTIREELASAAREFRAEGAKAGRSAGERRDSREQEAQPDDAGGPTAGGEAGQGDESGQGDRASDEARRIREEARRSREQMRARFRAQGRSHGDWAAWAALTGKAERSPWSSWAEWAGFRDESDRDEPGRAESGEGAGSHRPGWARDFGPGAGERSRRSGGSPFSDLERMAMQFATELRAAAKQTGNVGERSLNDLRDILTDTLAKVRAEVFPDAGPGSKAADSEPDSPAQGDGETGAASSPADADDKSETE
ncbi:MAG TPA: PadR family transcriptional regulator [Streptosporangiaceae bacterium]|nr:PadR family transcriptional regulator [Streptosporangiaceae bacterium]